MKFLANTFRILPAWSRSVPTIAGELTQLDETGWIFSRITEGVCTIELGERCTLAYHHRGREATEDEVRRIRAGLLAIREQGDLENRKQARADLARIDLHLSPSPTTHSPAELRSIGQRRPVSGLSYENSPNSLAIPESARSHDWFTPPEVISAALAMIPRDRPVLDPAFGHEEEGTDV